MISTGGTLDQVMAARLTDRYDAQWGQEASWTAKDFIPVVYYELGGSALRDR
jgi:cyclase